MPRPPVNAPDGQPGTVALLAIPALVACLVAFPSIGGGFVRDDHEYVRTNPHVQGPAGLGVIFSSTFPPTRPLGLYRPVTTLSLRADRLVRTKSEPGVFHLTNMALAAIASALVAALGRRLGLAPRYALASGVVFAAHAARSEAVCWISGRAEDLLCVFAIGALVVAAGPKGSWRGPLAAALAILAAWSKEQGFVLAALLPMLPGLARRDRIARTIWVALGLCAAFAVRWWVVGGVSLAPGMAVLDGFGFGSRCLAGAELLCRYVAMIVWPNPLLVEYDESRIVTGAASVAAIAGAAIAAGTITAVVRWPKYPRAAFAVVLFVIPLVPVLNVFVRTGEIFAERFLALPTAGAALLVGLAAARIGRAGTGLMWGAAFALAVVSGLRATDWKSERSACDAQMRDAPDAAGSMWMMATSLLLPEGGTRPADPRDRAQARALLESAVRVDPGHVPARLTLSVVREQDRAATGGPVSSDEIAFLEESVRRAPAMPQLHGLLGLALRRAGRASDAKLAFERELSIMPTDGTASENLANILEQAGDPDGAARVRANQRRAVEAARSR